MSVPAAIPGRQGPPGQARAIVALVRPWIPILAVVLVCVLAGAALELAPPLLLRRIVDRNLIPRQGEGLMALAFLYLAATALGTLTGFLVAYFTSIAAQSALRELRVALFAHLQRLPMGWFDKTPLGDTISRCTADVEVVDELFSSGVVSVIGDLFRLVSIAVALVVLSPSLTAVAALVVPPVYVVTRAFRNRVRAAQRESRKAVGQVNVALQETLVGVEVIHAFARERAFAARFVRELKRMLRAGNRSVLFSAFYSPMMAILSAVAAAILLYAGAAAVVAGHGLSIGTLTAFVLLLQRFFTPIIDLGDDWQTVQGALSGIERIQQVLAEPPEPEAVSSEFPRTRKFRVEETPATAPNLVEVKEIVFGYSPGRPVLRGVSIAVAAGEHVAVVGRTGSGKSTLLSIVGGLYEPWGGSVRVLGADPRALPEAERRRALGIVPQTVQLFSGSVLENLSLGDTDVPDEAIRRAAALAGVDDFVRALPEGYGTRIGAGERRAAHQFSSGQRQLLALARALVFDPPLLVLDEATSSVDGESDAVFRAALGPSIARGRGVLTVAHRLATARGADRVVVLEAGRVVEEGPPAELVRRGGRFAALLELEEAGWDWRTDEPT